jgi:hypothetical protein
MAVVLLGACGTNAVVTPPPGQTTAAPSTTLLVQPPTTIAVSSTVEVLTALPYQWPDDLTEVAGFWTPLQMTGAFEIFRFRTLEELADSATVVVVAVAVGPGPSATIGGDPDNNEFITSRSLIVEVREVVRTRTHLLGIHTPDLGEHITVIMDHQPRTAISTIPVLLFLQAPDDDRYYFQVPPDQVAPEDRDYYIETLEAWDAFRAGKYRFLNSQSLLVGDGATTVSPWVSAYVDPLSPDISGVSIAEIVDLIRWMPPPEA